MATLIVVLLLRQIKTKKSIKIAIKQSQAQLFDLTKNTEQVIKILDDKRDTQASKHRESNMVRIVFLENQAYWIRDSVFYTADIDDEGFIDPETTRAVDTMTMDKVQLDKMSFIVEKLTEGK